MTAETMDATKNELIDGRDEILAAEAHERAGTMQDDAPEGFVRVVAVARHKQRYQDGTEKLRLPGQQYDLQAEKLDRALELDLVHLPDAFAFDWWKAKGRILAAEPCDAEPLMDAPSDGALKIIAGAGYDPGSAAFRLHTAINETTKHASAFVRWGDTNPHCSLRQLDGIADAPRVRQAVLEADVIHHHVVQFLANNTGIAPREDQLVIRHYHGSKEGGGSHLEPIWDRAHGYKLLGARLSLVAEAKAEGLEMDWSPIPVPVARYRALRDAIRADAEWTPMEGAATTLRPMRIAHSPTNERIKGSSVLRDVVRQLQAKGVPVVVDYIRGVSLAESLQRKALCDVCFDSFWLGIQGSGLEAGAMELPVIAGDWDVVRLYNDEIGHAPYFFVADEKELSECIDRMAVEPEYRALSTTAAYVEQYHDYEAVARRYEQSLAKWLGRDDVLTFGAPTAEQETAPKRVKRGRT